MARSLDVLVDVTFQAWRHGALRSEDVVRTLRKVEIDEGFGDQGQAELKPDPTPVEMHDALESVVKQSGFQPDFQQKPAKPE